MSDVHIIVIMGASGAGKTTVGHALSARLGWSFIEGDAFHSRRNLELMTSGHPLTDEDRAPWLASLRGAIEAVLREDGHAVVACSALRHAYRRVLAGPEGGKEVRFVHLDVPEGVLRERLRNRYGHFMIEQLLDSQLATLEPSLTALVVDGTKSAEEIVDEVAAELGVG